MPTTTQKPKEKNLWAKTRPISNPYATVSYNGWTWRILKAYQSRSRERTNRFARYYCAVSSPFTYEGYDIGDVYISGIPMTADLVAALEERATKEATL